MKNILFVCSILLVLVACDKTKESAIGPNKKAGSLTGNSSVSVFQKTVAPGDQCPSGGVSIDVGIDNNGNGTLEPDEISQTEIVCNGINASARTNIVEEPKRVKLYIRWSTNTVGIGCKFQSALG